MLDKILNWGLIALITLLPLFFLPLTTDFYDFNKNWLLISVSSFLLLAWAGKMVLEKRVTWRRTPFDLPVMLFSLSFIASLIFASANKVEALTMPGGVGTILALTAIYFLITNHVKENYAAILLKGLLASASFLSLIAIYQFFGVGETLIPANQGLDWLRVKTFSPAGGPLVLVTFLGVCLVMAMAETYAEVKKSQKSLPFFLCVLTSLLITAGLGLTASELVTQAKPILLPQTAGWVIALEAFKNFPFFGVGLENFVAAFTTGKPLTLNLNQYWAFRFGVSSNFYFYLLTTVGIFGLATYLFLVWKVIKSGLANLKAPFISLCVGLSVIFLVFVFLPVNFLLLLTSFVLLGLLGSNLVTQETKEESNLLPNLFFLCMILVVAGSLYGAGRVVAAELFFKQSLDAAAQNKGMETYNLQIKSLQINPYVPAYHIAYSQINLALANAIASKKDLTDQDRQNISQLIQQSIREAKAATSLGQANVVNWENLANIYRSLINFAQGADQWTVAAYNQAISLDPANPLLRLDLGGVYFSLKNYDEAIRQFTLVTNLKPDYANGHYNLAAALKEKGLLKEAVQEMAATQALLEPETNDYKKITQELEELRVKLPKEEKTGTPSASLGQPETLTPPPATAPAGLKPPLTLPEEAQPEVSTPLSTESGKLGQ